MKLRTWLEKEVGVIEKKNEAYIGLWVHAIILT